MPEIIDKPDDTDEYFGAEEGSDEVYVSEEFPGEGYLDHSSPRFHTNFSNDDILPFENFRSYIGKEGNCTGMAWVTALVYNTGRVDAAGSFDFGSLGKDDIGLIGYDLYADELNATFLDRGLSDYAGGLGTHLDYNNPGVLSGETLNAVNMIGIHWQRGNIYSADDELMVSGYRGPVYNYRLIEEMMRRLDDDKILCISLSWNEGRQYVCGHAINIVDYEVTDDGEVRFYTYDSNAPKDARARYIAVRRFEDTFIFAYIYDDEGHYTDSSMETYEFIVFDEKKNNLTQEYGVDVRH